MAVNLASAGVLELVEELARREECKGKIHKLYPDEGPYRRDLYPQHMRFFAEGKKRSSRMAMAGNGVGKCVTYQTLIETPSGSITAGELFERGEPFDVLAWNGQKVVKAKAEPPFKKPGLHKCYRIKTRFGEIEAADHHRIFVDGKWRFVEQVAARFHASSQSPHLTSGEGRAFESPVLGANGIISVDAIGVQEVYDFTVHEHHNYIAGGLVNHNTFGIGGYETALHLTGQYPDWWPGHRYKKPIKCWVAGKTKETTRDNQQSIMLGTVNAEQEGGGLIPTDCIDFGSIYRRSQGGGAIDSVRIRHSSGGWSKLQFKSYDQKLSAFFGENLDLGWMDEPAPVLIYSEIMARFRGSDHPCMMVTFTPKDLRAEQAALVDMFTESESESRALINIAWEDVPHLTEEFKRDLLANTPVWMRDTVSKGVVALGSGAVYPVPEERFVIDPLPEIPDHWPRIAGFDGGWHNTAVTWWAWDRDADVIYLYSEHKAGEMAVPLHAAAIKARGDWIPIVGDAGARDQTDGKKCRDEYAKSGVRILQADKAVSAGVNAFLTRLLTGRAKAFRTCTEWLKEYRTYHYDEKTGNIVKVNDHLMDTSRYVEMGLKKYAKSLAESKVRAPNVPATRFGRRY